MESLGERPLQEKERSSLYHAITAEIQASGAAISVYTNRLEELIAYIGCLPHTPTVMEADDVIEIITCIEEAGISVWLDGGWGVDALLGVETRTHDDLDIVMSAAYLSAAQDALRGLGFVRAVDELPTRCVLRDAGIAALTCIRLSSTARAGGSNRSRKAHPSAIRPKGWPGWA